MSKLLKLAIIPALLTVTACTTQPIPYRYDYAAQLRYSQQTAVDRYKGEQAIREKHGPDLCSAEIEITRMHNLIRVVNERRPSKQVELPTLLKNQPYDHRVAVAESCRKSGRMR